MEKTKYLIIGAGVSGLSFADWIDSEDYLIFEAEDQIGGYCKTIQKSGFTWDYSGHFFHFKNLDIERDLVARMGDHEVLQVKKISKIFWKGGWIDFPFQKNIHQLPKDELIDCIYGLYFRPNMPASNFKEMLYHKFGAGIADRFLIPYNQKLYATDLANLDMSAMGRFFPYADVDEIIKNSKFPNNSSYNDTFTYPTGGAVQYVNALAKDIPKNRISLNERIVSIDVSRRTAQTNLRTISYGSLISSVPLVKLLEYCNVKFQADTYAWNKVLVFNLGFDGKGLDNLHWAYFPQPDICFYRIGFYDNILNSNRMSLYVEIGLDRSVTLTSSDVERYRQRVLADLQKSGIVTKHVLVDWHSILMDPAYVHITERSIEEVTRTRRMLTNHGIHSIGRYGGWTYCSIEDNIIEARELADTFNTPDLS